MLSQQSVFKKMVEPSLSKASSFSRVSGGEETAEKWNEKTPFLLTRSYSSCRLSTSCFDLRLRLIWFHLYLTLFHNFVSFFVFLVFNLLIPFLFHFSFFLSSVLFVLFVIRIFLGSFYWLFPDESITHAKPVQSLAALESRRQHFYWSVFFMLWHWNMPISLAGSSWTWTY